MLRQPQSQYALLLVRSSLNDIYHSIQTIARENQGVSDAALEGDFHPLHPLAVGNSLPDLAEHLVKDRQVMIGHRTRPPLRSMKQCAVRCPDDGAPYPAGDGVNNVQRRRIDRRGHHLLHVLLLLLRHGLGRLLILLLILWLIHSGSLSALAEDKTPHQRLQ